MFLNPDDAAAHGRRRRATSCGSRSRRGSIELSARLSHRDTPGTCFIPFHFREAAANVLTIDEIDPTGKIPEFKFCAVKVEAGWRDAARSLPGAEARAGRFPGPALIPDLHAIQREHGWLPREELVTLARDRRRPLYEIEGLISFYPHFRTAPPPERRDRLLPRPGLLAARVGRADRGAARRARLGRERGAARGVVHRALRPRAGRLHRDTSCAAPSVQRPNDPYDPDARDYRVLRAASPATRASSSRR